MSYSLRICSNKKVRKIPQIWTTVDIHTLGKRRSSLFSMLAFKLRGKLFNSWWGPIDFQKIVFPKFWILDMLALRWAKCINSFPVVRSFFLIRHLVYWKHTTFFVNHKLKGCSLNRTTTCKKGMSGFTSNTRQTHWFCCIKYLHEILEKRVTFRQSIQTSI